MEYKASKRIRGTSRETVGRGGSPFNRLPDECIVEIFSYNPDPADRCSCAAVSKKWLVLQAHMKPSDFKLLPPTPSNASAQFTRCLEGCTAVDTRLAAMVVSKLSKGRVTNLSIRGSHPLDATSPANTTDGVTDCGLRIVGSSFPYLRSIALWGCHRITCRGLAFISEGCAILEKLDLCECPLLTDSVMPNVARKLKNLLSLTIDSCQKIGNGTLKAFGSFTPTLLSFSVVGCPLVGDEGFLHLVGGLPNLKRMKIDRVSSSICVVLENVRKVKGLTSLSLGELQPCDSMKDKKWNVVEKYHCFRSLGEGCSSLKNISMSRCSFFDDHGLRELAGGAIHLENLTLEASNRISFNGLVDFIAWHSKNLKSLTLVKCKGIIEPGNWATPQSPPSCNLLVSVRFRQCPRVGDGFFKWLGSVCGRLHEVELIGMRGISDDGLMGLLFCCRERTPQLNSLCLIGCMHLTDVSVFRTVTVCGEKLRALSLGRCPRVSGHCLELIAVCCPNLMDLDLSEFEIADDELVHLNQRAELLGVTVSMGTIPSSSDGAFGCNFFY